MKFCEHCGAQRSDTSKFCPKCGQIVKNMTNTSPQSRPLETTPIEPMAIRSQSKLQPPPILVTEETEKQGKRFYKKKTVWIICACAILSVILGIRFYPNGENAVLLTHQISKASATDKEGKLTIAMVTSLSNYAAPYGVSHQNGLELALAEINKAGGVKSQKIELLTYDDEGDPRQAAAGAQKFADMQNVLAIAGSCLSSNTLAMVPITDRAKIPHTAVSSSSQKLSGMSKYFFRMAIQDDKVGGLMVDLSQDKFKPKKIALLYLNNDYGKGLLASIEPQVKKYGVTLTSAQTYRATDKDYSALLTKVKAEMPDVLLIGSTYNDGGLIVKQAREMGLMMPIVGPTGLYNPQYMEIAGKAVANTYFLGVFVPNNPDPKVQEFVKKYKGKYGIEPDTFAALAYDQGYVLKDAMDKAAAKGAITRESLREAMAASSYKGITGTVTFDAKGDWVRPYLLVTIKDREFVVAR